MAIRGHLGAAVMSRFHAVGQLGAGGFGAVYEMVDVRTGERVAVKELETPRADAIARFKNEFRALADCHHPNLVALHELIEQDGRWLIVMELVPGTDLLTYIRGAEQLPAGRGFHEGHLRSALSGVAEGLRALHEFGVMHRDLKPSNVRVRPDGRVVLLDFGLVTSITPERQTVSANTVGTVRYMAPEQAGAKRLGPAVDYYALGVCLFEALTGRAPFEGEHGLAIMIAKQQNEAPRASSLVAGVPPDLDELCARLLALDPDARPGADEVLSVLGGGARRGESASSQRPRAQARTELFAGREAELEHLERALAATHRGEPRIVLVEGESGVGKSELVAEFLRRAALRRPTLWALRGRCYENEQVSYKAFDGCIDELSKLLRGLPAEACAALLPLRATLLGQLFPVLRNIQAIAGAPREGVSADPTSRRLEAFAALVGLLDKIAEERPLVLVMDDLQWADAESFRMLQALIENSAPPPVLFLATIRPRDELEADVQAHVKALRDWRETVVVPLSGLPREQTKALARKLLGAGTPDTWLEMIADESDGHPLFLHELVQYTQSQELGARGNLTLEAALRARVERLDRRARELLELVALAARPHGRHVFAHALGLPNIEEPARQLLAMKLLRQRKAHELGCYHDRIRRTVSELVGSLRRPALHRQLAVAMNAAREVDAAEQAHHWDLAGETEGAIGAYQQAVTRALETLAFARAAQLCARAIELIGNSGDPRAQQLTAQRAHALACAGRSREAAFLFQQSADAAQGDARIRLRAHAALNLLLSAQTNEGFRAAHALLTDLGIRVPLSTLGSLLRFAWDSLCLRWETWTRALPGRREGEPQERSLVLDVLLQLTGALTVIDPRTMLPLASQRLRLGLRASSFTDTSLALAEYGWLMTVRRSLARALPLFEKSRRVLEEGTPDPQILAGHAYIEGSARLAGFDFTNGSACLERAQELAREHCPDQPWLLTHIRYHLGAAWNHLGEHARLARHAELWLAEVRERNDVLSEALLCGMGHCFLRHLMADAPDKALAEHAASFEALPAEPFSFAHFGLFLSKSYTLLYRGGPAALHWLDSFEPQRKRVSLFATRMGRDGQAVLRAHAMLHTYVGAAAHEHASLAREARRSARWLAKRSPMMQAYASLIHAQLEALQESRVHALEHARAARHQFERLRVGHRQLALFLEGVLEGGDDGQRKRESALDAYRAQGWRVPLRAFCMSCPTLPLLLEGHAPSRPRSDITSLARVDRLHAPAKLLCDRYEVLAPIASGGFGSVSAARDVNTGKKLALKQLVRGGGRSLERFKREFRALQDVHHDNLVRLHALLEDQGRWYIAMELIDGAELLAYVRPEGRLDLRRLTHAMHAIARALMALHEAGFVHRDLKPANVRVTTEGRVVLLDFGLIARSGDSEDDDPAGTVDYSSPEQLTGARPHPASDVYALGVCLYEGLLGRLPFPGATPLEVVQRKRSGQPVRSAVPADLEPLYELALRMLATEPAARPQLPQVVQMIASMGPEVRHELAPADARELHAGEPGEVSFAGREQELTQLAQAFERTCDEGLVLAFVEGESGVGKSALVAEFARRMRASWDALHVLDGRCYENEQLAFKAFDGAVDRLAAVLCALSNPQCEALLPRRAALLAQLFPVLSSVPAIADASRKGLPAEPAAQKLAARACFVELLENLSARAELLFVIDDLQWADAESFALLSALLERRERLPLLILCTLRPGAELTPDVAAEIARLRALPNCEHITLAGLSDQAASKLAGEFLGASIDPARLAELVRESNGHPLFLRELANQEQRAPGDVARAQFTLRSALEAHVAALPERARELLSLAALAGRPVPAHVYAIAMDQPELPRDALIALLTQALLQRRGEDLLACYHDTIRGVVLATLSSPQRKTYARALAAALEQTHTGEPAERARLWEEAGERMPARAAHEQAGHRALSAFAFTQAEQHFARAIELFGSDTEASERDLLRRLLEQRGHALVRAGRSAEAACMFQLGAERAEGETAVRLRIWAAQHLMQSAQTKEGMRAATELLRELGISLPRSERAALAQIAWERARVRFRGSALQTKSRHSTERERLALEALNGLSSPVGVIWYLPGWSLVAQYLRRALDAGEPVHAARALALEALFRTLSSPERDHGDLFAQGRELAERAAVPALIAEIELLRGISCVVRNRFTEAPTHLSEAHDLLQTRCPGEPWLLTSARQYLGFAWFYAGDMGAIARHTGGWVEEAKARDDRYALAALSGMGCASLRFIVQNRPEEGLAELERALAPWPERPFSANHFGHFVAKSSLIGYTRPGEMLTWLEGQRERQERSFLMRTPASRFMLATVLATAIMRALPEAHAGERVQLLARLDLQIHALQRMRAKAAPGVASMFQGVALLAQGERARALARFRAAYAVLSQVGIFWSYTARYLEGRCEGGEEGRVKAGLLLERLRADGWADPQRALAFRVPGLHLLD